MIRLYTAVGTFKFNKHGLPTIVCADREYGLTSMELVLWSCLSFRILTYDELRKEFYEKESSDAHSLGADLRFHPAVGVMHRVKSA